MNTLVRPPLAGEILSGDDDIRVYCAPHPLRNARHELRAPAGSTVAEIVDMAVARTGSASKATDFVVLLHDGHVVPRENWARVRPKPGTQVAMRPLPTGPITSLITAGITSALASIGITGIFAQLLVAGLAIGAKFLLNMLFKPKEKQQENVEPKPSFSITGSRNQASQFAAVPVILGTHRVTPLYASGPYTETIGNDQYLRLLFVVGYGPLLIPQAQIKIGETPIDHFDDIVVQIRQGYPTDSPTSIYPRQMPPELGLGIELLFADGFHQQTTPDNITEIALDIVLPQGLLWVDGSGERHDVGVTIAWRYRKVGTVPWTNAANLAIAGRTQDVIRRTARVAVAAGQYEVEVKKANAEPVLPTTDSLLDTVQWTALRCFRVGEPILFADPVAVIALRIRATSQLNGVVDTLNCVASSLVKSWNGSTWVNDVASSRPGDLFRHVLQHTSNKRPVPDSRLDLVALQNWNVYCANNGFTYKKPILSQGSVFDLLQEIAAAGRAMPVFKDGKWSVVWDEQNPPVVQMFTPRNSWGFEASHQYRVLPHAFRMRFVNAAKGYVDDERIVYDDGYTAANASKFESFEMPGVTDSNTVWKHGRYHIAQLRLRPATYTLNVDFEGMVLTRNDRVRVQHDVMLVGLASGRVKSVSGQTVTLDESLLLSSANPVYGFRFRLSNNTYITRTCPGVDGEFTSITLSGTGTMPVAGDLFAFGISGSETEVYRVLGIEPQENLVHRLTLVDDAPGVSLADTGTIPDYDSGITEPLDPFELPPTDIRLTDGAYDEGGQFYAYLGVSWLLPRIGHVRRILIEYRNEADGIWRPSPSVTPDVTSTTIRKVEPGLYTVRVRAIFTDGTFSTWCTSAVYNASAALNPPGDVAEFRIATLGDTSTLSWSLVIGAGITYQIRFSPLLTGVAWNAATPLLPSISGTSAQVPTAIGTYLIKAQLPSGIVSLNATSIVASIAALAGFNAVETLTESPTFPGTKTDVEVVSGELRLRSNNTLGKWERLGDVISMRLGDGGDDTRGMEIEGTYAFAGSIDLGQVFTSRITATVDAYGFDLASTIGQWLRLGDVLHLNSVDRDDWTVVLEYRSSLDAVVWSDWQQFVIGDVTARALQFRLRLFGKQGDDVDLGYSLSTPSVVSLTVDIDMPDRVIGGNDIAVTGAGLTVPFTPPFRSLKGFAINAQNMQTGDYATVTAKSATGFTIIFKNAAGTGVARTFDYNAVGYGTVG